MSQARSDDAPGEVAARFGYVGPSEVRARSQGAPKGTPLVSRDAARNWLRAHGREDAGWATYVVSLEGALLVAPRRSEHVACAGGEAVRAAGEIRFDPSGGVVEVTNHSTGYCPREDCWPAVRAALDLAGLGRPDGFTAVMVFRRCARCGERNLVKNDWYVCALCDAELPMCWNFDTDPGLPSP